MSLCLAGRRAFGFRRETRGSAAIEFALVGPVFVSLIFAILETGLLMLKLTMLDYAVGRASKFVYAGAAQRGDVDRAAVEAFICERARIFNNCETNIVVELTPIADFDDFPTTSAICVDADDEEEIKPIVSYSPGGGSQIVFMRVCVTTDVITPALGLGMRLTATDTGRSQAISFTAFRNEPF